MKLASKQGNDPKQQTLRKTGHRPLLTFESRRPDAIISRAGRRQTAFFYPERGIPFVINGRDGQPPRVLSSARAKQKASVGAAPPPTRRSLSLPLKLVVQSFRKRARRDNDAAVSADVVSSFVIPTTLPLVVSPTARLFSLSRALSSPSAPRDDE